MHIPVLFHETIDALAPRAGGRYLDGTLGGGGHAEEVLKRCGPDGTLLGLDRDEAAIARCRERLAPFGDRFEAVHSDFAAMADVAAARGLGGEDTGFDGILLDLGVSSFQLDEADRGFSFRADGPLDMRMDRSKGPSAAELIASFGDDWRKLAELIHDYGEERWAGPIARAVLVAQAHEPIVSTERLAGIVAAAVPRRAWQPGRHPATRTFQALRIAVNDELGQIERALEAAISLLAPGGRLAVISFHSLEDRLVKRAFVAHEGREISLQQGGSRWEGTLPAVERVLRKPVSPSEEECAANPRARSSKLRCVMRAESEERSAG